MNSKLVNAKNMGAVLSLSLVAGCATAPKVTTLDPKVESTLSSYQEKIQTYESKNARFLAPSNFERAEEVMKTAKEMAYEGKSLQEINTFLEKNGHLFEKMDKNLKLSAVHLKEVLEARKEALDEGAEPLELFKKANSELAELGEELEENDINEVLEEREMVRALFNQAEIKAIKERELSKASQILEETQELSGSGSFEKEYDSTLKDIASAEKLISEFKDEKARYLPAVKKAEFSAKRYHALSSTATWIENNNTRDVSLKIDSDLSSILLPLSYDNADLKDYDEKVDLIKKETNTIPYLVSELTSTQYQAYVQKNNLTRLKNENKKISNKLESKEEQQRKIDKLRKTFSKDEAEILIKDDDVIIRLVGLNFGFDKAEVPSKSEELLKKVAKSADQFSYPSLKIIGHADSKGDALYNEKLSKKRAENVRKFLVENTSIPSDKTEVVGVGFREPVAENKSKSGRQENRRIDVVLNSVVTQK